MRKWFVLMFMLVLPTISAFAQDDISGEMVFIRAAHFAADAPAVDIYINGDLTLEGLEFPGVSDYLEVEAGTYSVEIVASGEDVSGALLAGDYDLSAGDWATLVAIGTVADDSLEIQAIVEDLGNVPDGSTYFSAFHAIADLAPVTIVADEAEFVSSLAYSSSTGFETITDDYTFDIQDTDGNSLLSLDETTLEAGFAYFVAAVGTAENPQVVVIPTELTAMSSSMDEQDGQVEEVDTGNGTALARIAHFSITAPDVDVYIDGELVLETVLFGDVTDYTAFGAGTYEVSIVPVSEPLENAIATADIALIADTVTLVAVIGFIENDSVEIVTAPEDNTPPEPGFSRVAFFQAIPSVELFDLTANDNTLVQGLAYPEIFTGAGDGYADADIPADAYEFEVTGAGNTLNVGNVTTGSGRVYLIVSAGVDTSPIFFLISSNFPVPEEE